MMGAGSSRRAAAGGQLQSDSSWLPSDTPSSAIMRAQASSGYAARFSAASSRDRGTAAAPVPASLSQFHRTGSGPVRASALPGGPSPADIAGRGRTSAGRDNATPADPYAVPERLRATSSSAVRRSEAASSSALSGLAGGSSRSIASGAGGSFGSGASRDRSLPPTSSAASKAGTGAGSGLRPQSASYFGQQSAQRVGSTAADAASSLSRWGDVAGVGSASASAPRTGLSRGFSFGSGAAEAGSGAGSSAGAASMPPPARSLLPAQSSLRMPDADAYGYGHGYSHGYGSSGGSGNGGAAAGGAGDYYSSSFAAESGSAAYAVAGGPTAGRRASGAGVASAPAPAPHAQYSASRDANTAAALALLEDLGLAGASFGRSGAGAGTGGLPSRTAGAASGALSSRMGQAGAGGGEYTYDSSAAARSSSSSARRANALASGSGSGPTSGSAAPAASSVAGSRGFAGAMGSVADAARSTVAAGPGGSFASRTYQVAGSSSYGASSASAVARDRVRERERDIYAEEDNRYDDAPAAAAGSRSAHIGGSRAAGAAAGALPTATASGRYTAAPVPTAATAASRYDASGYRSGHGRDEYDDDDGGDGDDGDDDGGGGGGVVYGRAGASAVYGTTSSSTAAYGRVTKADALLGGYESASRDRDRDRDRQYGASDSDVYALAGGRAAAATVSASGSAGVAGSGYGRGGSARGERAAALPALGPSSSASTASAPMPVQPMKSSAYSGSPRGLFGLTNLGNTCFMNSCLQCVSNVPPLTDIFLARDLHVNRSSATSRTRGEVATAWQDLMTRFWGPSGSRGGVETPSRLKKVVGSVASRFLGYDQQDSQEFLVFLLDALIDDTNRITAKVPYRELGERPDQSDAEVSADWWQYYTDRFQSAVHAMVSGQLKTTVRCEACGHVSRAFDPFTNLALPIPKSAQAADKMGSGYGSYGGFSSGGADDYGGGGCSLADCLSAFVTPERLSGTDAAYCSRCKKHQPVTKTMALYRLPPVLILQLKRFTFSTFRRTKLTTNVRFPTAHGALDLRPYVVDKAPGASRSAVSTYTCVAVSNHSGSLGGGHYTADALNRDDGQWYHFNDSHVSQTSPGRLSGSAAYLLFYVRSDLL